MSNVGTEVKLTSDGNLRRVHRRIYRVAITTNGLLSLSWRVCGSSLSRLYLCKVWLTYLDGDGTGVLASKFRLSKQSIARHQGVPKDQGSMRLADCILLRL